MSKFLEIHGWYIEKRLEPTPSWRFDNGDTLENLDRLLDLSVMKGSISPLERYIYQSVRHPLVKTPMETITSMFNISRASVQKILAKSDNSMGELVETYSIEIEDLASHRAFSRFRNGDFLLPHNEMENFVHQHVTMILSKSKNGMLIEKSKEWIKKQVHEATLVNDAKIFTMYLEDLDMMLRGERHINRLRHLQLITGLNINRVIRGLWKVSSMISHTDFMVDAIREVPAEELRYLKRTDNLKKKLLDANETALKEAVNKFIDAKRNREKYNLTPVQVRSFKLRYGLFEHTSPLSTHEIAAKLQEDTTFESEELRKTELLKLSRAIGNNIRNIVNLLVDQKSITRILDDSEVD